VTVETALCAYAAGIIDGEGSITANVRRRGGPAAAPIVVPRIAVAMTNVPTLDLLASLWGGTVFLRSFREETTHRRPVYVWESRGHALAACLRDVLPFLRIKRPQAEAALALYERRNAGLRRVDEDETNARLALAGQIREANRGR
jgi:hypothetical protein